MYSDYRDYLKCHFRDPMLLRSGRRTDPFWQYLRLIIEDRVYLREESINSLLKLLGLAPLEERYFRALVRYRQNPSQSARAKLISIRKRYARLSPSTENEIVLYMDPI